MSAAAVSAAFRRPAEWARHSRTILAWPDNANWYAKDPEELAEATNDVSSIADAVSRFEPVTLLVGKKRLNEAKKRFKSKSSAHEIDIVLIEGYDLDLWMRDMAPSFTLATDKNSNPRLYGIDFNFNGWGNRYPPKCCNSLAKVILEKTKILSSPSSLVLEGGALELDGEGTLLATESSIINKNRNPELSRDDIERELKRALGVSKIIWIPGRKSLDITDEHIDGLVRFIEPGRVVLSKPNTLDNTEWTKIYYEARDILANAIDAHGRSLEVSEIVEADMYLIGLDKYLLKDIEQGREDAPALTYVNWLMVNGGVIFPQFGDKKADSAALNSIKRLYQDRTVYPVLIRELPLIGGGIHCSTQEIPWVSE